MMANIETFLKVNVIGAVFNYEAQNMTLKNDKIDQAKDTGLAMVLILLIVQYVKHPGWLIMATMAVLVLVMTWPAAFSPLARFWFGLSHFLGSIVSKILLTVVFFLIVTLWDLSERFLALIPCGAEHGARGMTQSWLSVNINTCRKT
jgi:hypothetical protein